MEVKEILGLIEETRLQEIGAALNVDKKNQKITGSFILKSFVLSILRGRPISSRSIERLSINNAMIAKELNCKKESNRKIDHSSLSKRINSMPTKYFAEIYKGLSESYERLIPNVSRNMHRFDSTIINLSGRVINGGLKIGGKPNDWQIKMTVGLRNNLPKSIRFCESQSESSENIALVKAINESIIEQGDILLFDRGISKASTYEGLEIKNYKFVTRISPTRNHKVVKERPIDKSSVLYDADVKLYISKGKVSCVTLRMIKMQCSDGSIIQFLTNIDDLKAEEIGDLYRRRWDIEVFFKFIKQNLQFKRFLSHSLCGMKVYLYCVLIAAILFLIYKELNGLKGFKIALLDFGDLIEKEMIIDLIILSGGNPDLVRHRL